MPFAEKFRKAMQFPAPGDTVGGFSVESSTVEHEGTGEGVYRYPFELVLSGPGGRQGVRSALRELFSTRRTVFSGYGNPYQLKFGKIRIDGAGAGRYVVSGHGIGVRISLDAELERFLEHLGGIGLLSEGSPPGEIVADYLERYQADARRKPPRR